MKVLTSDEVGYVNGGCIVAICTVIGVCIAAFGAGMAAGAADDDKKELQCKKPS